MKPGCFRVPQIFAIWESLGFLFLQPGVFFCAFLGAGLPASACNHSCSSPSPAMSGKWDKPGPSISGLPLT